MRPLLGAGDITGMEPPAVVKRLNDSGIHVPVRYHTRGAIVRDT
jgi:hypothetical protein